MVADMHVKNTLRTLYLRRNRRRQCLSPLRNPRRRRNKCAPRYEPVVVIGHLVDRRLLSQSLLPAHPSCVDFRVLACGVRRWVDGVGRWGEMGEMGRDGGEEEE